MQESLNILTIDLSAGRYAVVTITALIAGFTDVFWLRISNWLTLPLLAGGLSFHAFASTEKGLLFALLGAFMGFCLLVCFFIAGGMGAGDVKLLAGIGAWIGPRDVTVVCIVAALLVGLCSLLIFAWNKSGTENWLDFFHPRKSRRGETVESIAALAEPTRRARLVPMGTMIALALLILIARDSLGQIDSGM